MSDNTITIMDAMMYAMEGEDPSKAIKNQEKRGQHAVVRSQKLPKKLNDHSVPREVRWNGIDNSMEWKEQEKIATQNNIEYTKQQYEQMGITIIGEYDELFWNVELPDEWKVEATDHAMWNNLLDEKGRKRADFFYKASCYDRDAFTNFCTRYHAYVDHTADPCSEYEVWKKSDYQGVIKDGETVIFSTECVKPTGSFDGDDVLKDSLQKKLDQYMEENYPDYKNIHAYWN